MKRFFKIAVRILSWTILGLIALLCLAILLLQTQPVKRQIVRIAEQQADQFLNAKLSIGQLNGNFFTNIRLDEISLIQQNDTIASIKQLDLHYALWPLLKKQIIIESASITKPQVHIAQLKDSTWNFSNLVKEPAATADRSSGSEPLNWLINLQQFVLRSGSVHTTTSDSLIPVQIDGITIQLNAKYSSNEQVLNLDTFRVDCSQPDFSVKQLTFNLHQLNGTVTLSRFLLQTKQNNLKGQGSYASTEHATLDLQTDPFYTDEFQFVLPDLKIKVYPQIKWQTELQNDQLNSTISLVADNQKIDLNMEASPFMAWINKPDSVNLQYKLDSKFENVLVEEWSGIAGLQAHLNGTLQMEGEGTDPKTLKAQANAEIQNTSFAGYEIKQLTTQNDYQAGKLRTEVDVKTNFANLTATADISNILSNPEYQVRLQSSVFNLNPFIKNDSLETKLNLNVSARGSGFDPKQMKSRIHLQIGPSMLLGIPIDTANTNIRFKNQQVTIDTLMLRNQSAEITAKGTYNFNGQSDLLLNSKVTSLDAFRALLTDTMNLKTDANIQAHLFGTPDSMQIQAHASVNNSAYQDFKIERAKLDACGYFASSGFEFTTALNAQKLSGSGFTVDSIAAESTIHKDSAELQTSIHNEFLDTKLNATVNWEKELKINLKDWLLSVYGQDWKLQQPSEFIIDSTSYRVNHFELMSQNNETINIDGIFNQQGALDLDVDISNLDLELTLQPMELAAEIKGLSKLKMALRGTARMPIIDSHLQIDSLAVAGFGFKQADASLLYQNGRLNFNSNLALNGQGGFTAEGSTPLLLDLAEMNTVFSADSAINARAEIKDLPLALIQPFIHASEVTGLINGAFQFEGSLNSPQPSGNVRLDNGNLKVNELGVDYRNLKLETTIDKETISIDTLGITTTDGKLTGGGKIFFDSVFYQGRIKESTLNFNFDKFNPIDHKQINMQLSGNANVSGKKDTIVFDGNLSIPQSEIYLPALLNLFGKVYTPEIPKPILVQELEKQQSDTIAQQELLTPIEFKDSLEGSTLSNVVGRIKLKIPKNTWIKDPNLRVELSGDLEILKNPNNVEIFGSINVVRGQYELFGRTFIVSEGTVTFEGGDEMNPRLNLTATYTIKNRDSESKTLAVKAGGTALEPTVSFTLDNESITEGDALSYIIFGRGLNELSVSEQDDVSSVTGETMAKSAAASLLASQLTKFLGSKINVDYIEVKSQDNFDNASLEVGKYLTSDIFVSYEQQFGNSTDDDLSRYEVKLEYEIFRFLFLQLNNSSKDSGFDVIFKLQAK